MYQGRWGNKEKSGPMKIITCYKAVVFIYCMCVCVWDTETRRRGGICWLFQAALEGGLIANTWGLGTVRAEKKAKHCTLCWRGEPAFSSIYPSSFFFSFSIGFNCHFCPVMFCSSYEAGLSMSSPSRHVWTSVNAYSWKLSHKNHINNHTRTAFCTQHVNVWF